MQNGPKPPLIAAKTGVLLASHRHLRHNSAMSRLYKFFDSLSLRVLVLTIAFVIISEIIILVPSTARSYGVILQQRIDQAYVASLALDPTRAAPVNFLDNLGLLSLRIDGGQNARHSGTPTTLPNSTINLGDYTLWAGAKMVLDILHQPQSRLLQIIGTPSRSPGTQITIILDDTEIQQTLSEFTIRNIQLSVSVAVITALLVFAALQFYMVAPLQRLSASMTAFRHDPENPKTSITPSQRRDEIGTAWRELLLMQNGLRLALRQQARLAALGAAVTKINHDLRNILSTAQLVSDRIANIDDPNVQKLTPRLLTAIDRANHLCATTLDYAKEGFAPIDRRDFALLPLVQDIIQNLQLSFPTTQIDAAVPPNLLIHADRDQVFRIFMNLLRNAAEANAQHITLTAQRQAHAAVIRIADDGPGIKPVARERLFQPFIGSARQGGTGLGLTIARDLARAHDGDIALLETSPKGTIFELTLPDPQHPDGA